LVPPCVTLCRCRPLCCGIHGHIADGDSARERCAWPLAGPDLARAWPVGALSGCVRLDVRG
jgi:hypothetical protein